MCDDPDENELIIVKADLPKWYILFIETESTHDG